MSLSLTRTGPVNGGGAPARIVSQASFLDPGLPPWTPTCEEAWEAAQVSLEPAAMLAQPLELALVSLADNPVVVEKGTVKIEVLDIRQYWGPVIQCGTTPPIEDDKLPTWGGVAFHLGNPPVRQTATLSLEGDPPESPFAHVLFTGETARAHLYFIASNYDPGIVEEEDNITELSELYKNRAAARLRVVVSLKVRDYLNQQEIKVVSEVFTVVGLGFPQRWGYEPCENGSLGYFVNGQTTACMEGPNGDT
jgi:hypothetical protein